MATRMKTKRKTKPKIIEMDEPEVFLNGQTTSTEQTAVPTESTRIIPESRVDSQIVTINDSNNPSAPPEDQYEYRVTGLANDKIRAQFMSKVYRILLLQKGFFSAMITLFTYVPHMRKVFRKWIFDPLFLNKWIGFPLFIVPMVLMALFPVLRRKFSKWTFFILTGCFALMLSYAIETRATANAFLYSMVSANICDGGVIVGSKLKRDFTKWRYICLTTGAMIGSSFLAPTILNSSVNNTIWPSIATTFGTFALNANTRPVIKYNDLELNEDEYVFAAAQLYLNPERHLRHKIKQWFCGPSNQRERTGYTAIDC